MIRTRGPTATTVPRHIVLRKEEDIEKVTMAKDGKVTIGLMLTCGVAKVEGTTPVIDQVSFPEWTVNMKNIQDLESEKVRAIHLQRTI